MHRSILIVALLFLAAGCASNPARMQVAASAVAHTTSEEIDCMSECLSRDDENCESCVRECLAPTSEPVAPQGSIAGLGGLPQSALLDRNKR